MTKTETTTTPRTLLLEIAEDEAGKGFVEAAAIYLGLGFHPDTRSAITLTPTAILSSHRKSRGC